MSKSYTFDDILLIPQYSKISTRKKVDISSRITPNIKLEIPVIASCMDSVSGPNMVIAMSHLGAAAILHRYMTLDEQVEWVRTVRIAMPLDAPLIVAVGTKNEVTEHVKRLVEAGATSICVDVAHGHHQSVGDTVFRIRELNLPISIIAGNVATAEGAKFLAEAGTDSIRVGIGNGSICTTRLVTGHGVPQLTALGECHTGLQASGYSNVTIISDGGVRTSGDIVKAFAFGASAVMSGSLFAGSDEAPGQMVSMNGQSYKVYRGMASREAQEEFFGNYVDAPEGVNTIVPSKGPVAKIVQQLAGGIRSGLSYSGVDTIDKLYYNCDYRYVTTSSLRESQAVAPYKKD